MADPVGPPPDCSRGADGRDCGGGVPSWHGQAVEATRRARAGEQTTGRRSRFPPPQIRADHWSAIPTPPARRAANRWHGRAGRARCPWCACASDVATPPTLNPLPAAGEGQGEGAGGARAPHPRADEGAGQAGLRSGAARGNSTWERTSLIPRENHLWCVRHWHTSVLCWDAEAGDRKGAHPLSPNSAVEPQSARRTQRNSPYEKG